MTWDREWGHASLNIFEALRIKDGDYLAIIYNPEPGGKEYLCDALERLAKERNIPVKRIPVVLNEVFDVYKVENALLPFLKNTNKKQRKFFFTSAHAHFGPARRLVHKLICVDPAKFCGYAVSIPTDSADIVSSLASTSPLELLAKGEKIVSVLSRAERVRITSAKGTDVSFNWDAKRRKYLISAGLPHLHEDRWDNLGGEVFTAPLHESVNGRLVIDGSIGNMGIVDGLIVVDIKNGAGKTNRKESTAPEKSLDEFDREIGMYPCARVVGEFGVGTTPNLKLRGELLNDEKVEGTIHIAFGDSYSADGSGGENDCDNHTDCMILAPTVELTIEGRKVVFMSEGRCEEF